MPENKDLQLKVTNGTVNIEDLIDKINLADERGLILDCNPDAQKINDVVSMLQTNQLIRETKRVAEINKKFMDDAKRHADAFANPAARTGWGEDNLINATEYPMTRLTQDWQLLTSLYRTSWIVQRVCNVIPEDALADLSIEAPGLNADALQKLQEEIRTTHLRETMLKALRWSRLYGGAAAIMMVSGQEEDMSAPLDINNVMIGAFRGLYVVDRWSGIYPSLDLVDDDRDPDYGLPEYYEVRSETGGASYRVHHSRVLRFCGTEMPYWEQIAEQYWGTSAIEAMYDELIKRDNVAHNIANLTFKANLSVLQVENLDQMFATSSTVHQRRMYAMLSAINVMENSLGIRLVNKGDDIQQLQYSFSGLPEVMDSAMMDMAGATSIPVTRLFGRSPAGMNSTGESDEKMYRQTLEQERAVHITPALERLIPIVCRSAIGGFPAGATFKLPPLAETTPQDKADIIDRQVQLYERLFQANLIPAETVLEAARNAQLSLDVTSSISDEDVQKVRGKYFNDLQQQADPFGGAMQAASEAGGEPGFDEQQGESQTDEPQQQESDMEQQPEQEVKSGAETEPEHETQDDNDDAIISDDDDEKTQIQKSRFAGVTAKQNEKHRVMNEHTELDDDFLYYTYPYKFNYRRDKRNAKQMRKQPKFKKNSNKY